MIFNMTVKNPHPLANPLNQSQFRNYEFGQKHESGRFSINRTINPKDLTVPDSTSYTTIIAEQQRQLTVPNQDIPYYNGPVPLNGFLGQSTLFKLGDGSVLDMKSCKIVYDPNIKWKAREYWNDPNADNSNPQIDNEWKQDVTIEQMLAGIASQNASYDPNLSPESIEYWKKANEESKKLEQNLTDEQKKLLNDLHCGKMFQLSKLEDEK